MEHQILRIPLIDTIYDELDDAFIEEKQTAHDFVWGLVRDLCKDAKLGKLNKICNVNEIKDGKPQQRNIKLKEVTLQELSSNPEWIPKESDREEIKYFEHKVTDKTMEYLKLFGSFTILRHEKYADSLQEENDKNLVKMCEDPNTNEKIIENARESFEKSHKRFIELLPSCLEEVVYAAVYPKIHAHVTQHVSKIFDKENEEMYPKEEKPSK